MTSPYWPTRRQDRRGMTVTNAKPLMRAKDAGDLPTGTTFVILAVTPDGQHATVQQYELVGDTLSVPMDRLKPALPPHEQDPNPITRQSRKPKRETP